ncbi:MULTISPECIES: chemotaxis protein CheW [unclassified Caballeronia]|uniref:chemotaxis protein CheW n=1 Tax=unclassified Caballeronia TaxID=2646786 RepID=UPI00285ECC7F|nr:MULTISPECIES: chemotaxis protein CheW [unclassified Caballeronia]MDR5740571.1 chemotaxis protein CheW [Caballeronia sp. LZ016]MDR5808908.1 chemotaxis protein CheW [Caballeronia sp. LZ019]
MNSDQRHGAPEAGGKEFLIFNLGEEQYGIDILKVQEIRGYDAVTRVANAPVFIKGVINLRGVIVPIADMRLKFELARAAYDDQTVVVVLNVAGRVVGIVVDGVSDVQTLTPDQIRPAPGFNSTMSTDYITGIGTVDDHMLILMDIEKLITSEEMALMQSATA